MYNALIINDKLNLKNRLNNLTFKDGYYDYIFSFSNENVKEKYPYAMLVLFLENIPIEQSMGISLSLKSNLTIIMNDKIILHDPLGCVWYTGNNLSKCLEIMLDRLNYLQSITRQKTISLNNKNLALNWYFDKFKTTEIKSQTNIVLDDESEFLNLVKEYSDIFNKLMVKPKAIKESSRLYRCCKGMPSIRKNNYIVVSAREIENMYIEQSDLVAIYEKDSEIYYCGDRKPSVDAPIHLILYKNLPSINYIIHNHNYVKNAPFTKKSIPCGAVEEADEILNEIKNNYKNLNLKKYQINELGHGSIIMGENIEDLKNIEFVKRPNPEFIKEELK